MKFSVAATTAVALATGVVAKPTITNSAQINPQEGKPFTLSLSGCSSGCTVYLEHGADKNTQVPIKILSASATTSVQITLQNIGSGTYSIRVQDNSAADKDDNANNDYTGLFEYTGTGPTSFPPLSGTASSTSASSASSTGSSSSSASSGSSSSSSSSASKTSSSASSASTTSGSTTSAPTSSPASSTSASKTSSTTTSKPAATTPPSAGSLVSFSPVGLIGAAVAALFL